MIRQYRAFEDLEEPCYLVPEPEWITITYQMKSIICQWRWDEIKELKAKKLSPTKKKYPSSNSESVKDLTHSQTIIRPYSNSVPASPNLRNLNSHYHLKDPEKIIKKNLLRIEFLKRPESKDQPKFKWYRFDTRDILDEFLSDANRNGYIERLVISRWFSTKIKYQPKCLIEKKAANKINNNNCEDGNKKKLNRFRSNSNSSSNSSSSLELPEFIHNHKKVKEKLQRNKF